MLIQKIKERTACIGVIGLGYVGLPLVQEFGKAGFPVIGLDVDPLKVERLSKGESYIHHIPSESIAKMVKTGRFEATTDLSAVSRCECQLMCVSTP
ncbi:MAG: nucleotide sugar dehydrogenase, partial [Nitrospinae bacterium]|nr:nucleotide sugar dehydrogenase [Nitrospinota bacterium]